MADFTLTSTRFPVGTTVGVYARRTVIRDSGPIGAAITTAVTDTDLTTEFTGLAYDTDYTAASSVGGAWRWVQFTTDPDPASVALTLADLGILQESVAAEATARANADTGLTSSLTVINEALPTLDSLGAFGNGVADDTAFLAEAAETGIAHQLRPGSRYVTEDPIQGVEGGGFVGHNKFEMEGLTDPQDTVASEIVCFNAGDVIRLPNGGAGVGAEGQIAAFKLDGLRILATGAGACIAVPNGARGVEIGDVVLYPGVGGKGVHHKGFIQDWRVKHLRSYAGKYGWYADAEPGANGDACRMDRCDLGLYLSGATKYNGLMRMATTSDNCTLRLRCVSSAEHGFVIAGGFAGLLLENPNFEANGFSQFGITAPTTGSITAGSPTLTVASGTGFVNGQTICVRGAGPAALLQGGAEDLVTTISSGGGTTTLTLAANASTTVAGADVTRGLYSDFFAGVDLGSPEGLGTTIGGGPGNITFISPGWGLNDDLRYAANLYGPAAVDIINPKQTLRPVYDPYYFVPHRDDPSLYARFTPTRDWQLINDTANGGLNRFGADWNSAAGQNCAVRRVGRRVEFRGYATAGAAAGGTVCTLPPGCRPSRTIVFRDIYSSAEVQGVGTIAPTGVVTSFTTSAGTNVFSDDFSFTVD